MRNTTSPLGRMLAAVLVEAGENQRREALGLPVQPRADINAHFHAVEEAACEGRIHRGSPENPHDE